MSNAILYNYNRYLNTIKLYNYIKLRLTQQRTCTKKYAFKNTSIRRAIKMKNIDLNNFKIELVIFIFMEYLKKFS